MNEVIHEITHGTDLSKKCKHFNGLRNECCEAGVKYETVRLNGEWKYRYGKEKTVYTLGACYPCEGKTNFGGATCEKLSLRTKEEVAQREAEWRKHFEGTMQARAAIVEHLGGPWKRGTHGASGEINCPVCGGDKTLRFSRAGVNGHIHAACKTGGCVSWME